MGVLTPLAIRLGRVERMPRYLPQIVAVDRAIQRVSRGRVSVLDIAGLPNVTLTVRGRRTGIPRSTPLLAVPCGRSWLIAGSYFGGPSEPMWVTNLEAAGKAEITVKGTRAAFTSRLLDGADRPAAWEALAGVWPNFRLYQLRTDREIKVFELTPAA